MPFSNCWISSFYHTDKWTTGTLFFIYLLRKRLGVLGWPSYLHHENAAILKAKPFSGFCF